MQFDKRVWESMANSQYRRSQTCHSSKEIISPTMIVVLQITRNVNNSQTRQNTNRWKYCRSVLCSFSVTTTLEFFQSESLVIQYQSYYDWATAGGRGNGMFNSSTYTYLIFSMIAPRDESVIENILKRHK